MTDHTDSNHAALLRDLDSAAAGVQRLDRLDAESAAKAIRGLDAKVFATEVKLCEVAAEGLDRVLRIAADRDRLAGEVEEVKAEHAAMLADWDAMKAEVARLTSELAAAREEIARRDTEFNEPGRWGVCGSDLGDGTTCQTIVQRWTAGDLERAAAKAAELHAAVFGDAARRAGEEITR